MKWTWRHDAASQPLLNAKELQALYQQAHSAALPHSQRLLEQQQIGDVASRYRGAGLDYEESREYQAGDEPRFINWQLTARTGTTQLKQFREERRPSVFILLDHRDSMRFGTRVRLKAAQASRITALIAFAAAQQGWTVSAVRLSNEQTQWFTENTHPHDIWKLTEACSVACPPQESNLAPSLNTVLPLIQQQLSRGTHIYVISDFIDLNTDSDTHLLQLQNQHPIFTIQITDPIEIELPNAGHILLQKKNAEAGQTVDLSNKQCREQFKQKAEKHHTAIKQQLQGLGCAYYRLLTTEKSPESQIPLPHGLGT